MQGFGSGFGFRALIWQLAAKHSHGFAFYVYVTLTLSAIGQRFPCFERSGYWSAAWLGKHCLFRMPPPFAAHRLRVAMLIVVASMILFLGFSFYHCVSHPPVPPHLHKAAVVELAREWLEFASHCGIFFWIDYGSLLAAVRDKGEMMPWDHDADFSMLYSDVPLAMQHAAYFANRGITLSLHPTPRAGLRLTKHHIYIDIFGFDQDPEAAAFLTRSGRWHTIWGSPGPKENFPWYFVQPPLVNVTFEGMVSSACCACCRTK